MPRGDKTGPQGLGAKTGRAAGYCSGYSVPGFMNPTFGYGRGWSRGLGKGFGRGWRRGFGRVQIFYPQPIAVQPTYYTTPQREAKQQSPEQEIAVLENYQIGLQVQKADLEQEMDNIKSRIEELQKTIQEKSNK